MIWYVQAKKVCHEPAPLVELRQGNLFMGLNQRAGLLDVFSTVFARTSFEKPSFQSHHHSGVKIKCSFTSFYSQVHFGKQKKQSFQCLSHYSLKIFL